MTPNEAQLGTFQGLVQIVERLRAPGGCPWDREQTHESIRRNLLEETYEVLEAIDNRDPRALAEELGDILVQVVFHANMAREAGEFTLEDVFRSINRKLIDRHPHVFGDVNITSAGEVEEQWDAIKRNQRGGASSLDRVPRALPALAYSQSVQDRAARTGFDWPDSRAALNKLVEELEEVERAEDPEEREKELGDVLFAVVSVARKLGVHAEMALAGANSRFYGRFQVMEAKTQESGRSLPDLSLDEMLQLWTEAKEAAG